MILRDEDFLKSLILVNAYNNEFNSVFYAWLRAKNLSESEFVDDVCDRLVAKDAVSLIETIIFFSRISSALGRLEKPKATEVVKSALDIAFRHDITDWEVRDLSRETVFMLVLNSHRYDFSEVVSHIVQTNHPGLKKELVCCVRTNFSKVFSTMNASDEKNIFKDLEGLFSAKEIAQARSLMQTDDPEVSTIDKLLTAYETLSIPNLRKNKNGPSSDSITLAIAEAISDRVTTIPLEEKEKILRTVFAPKIPGGKMILALSEMTAFWIFHHVSDETKSLMSRVLYDYITAKKTPAAFNAILKNKQLELHMEKEFGRRGYNPQVTIALVSSFDKNGINGWYGVDTLEGYIKVLMKSGNVPNSDNVRNTFPDVDDSFMIKLGIVIRGITELRDKSTLSYNSDKLTKLLSDFKLLFPEEIIGKAMLLTA